MPNRTGCCSIPSSAATSTCAARCAVGRRGSGQPRAGSCSAARALVPCVAQPRRNLHLAAHHDAPRLARRVGRCCCRSSTSSRGSRSVAAAQLMAAAAKRCKGRILGVARGVRSEGRLLPRQHPQEIYIAGDVPCLGRRHLICGRGRRRARGLGCCRWGARARRGRRLGVQSIGGSDQQRSGSGHGHATAAASTTAAAAS